MSFQREFDVLQISVFIHSDSPSDIVIIRSAIMFVRFVYRMSKFSVNHNLFHTHTSHNTYKGVCMCVVVCTSSSK